MPIGHPRWRLKLFLSLPVVLILGAAAALAFVVAQWSATQSDAYSLAKELHFVRAQFERRIASITTNQQTVTVWTEAQKMVAGERDPEWLDGNLGIWLHNAYGFDRVFLLDEADKPIYSMIGGRRVDPVAYEENRALIAPIVVELRHLRSGPPRPGPVLGYLRRLVAIDGRPAVISASPIVDNDGNPSGEAGEEAVHIVVRRLDEQFFAEMGSDFLLNRLRFSTSGEVSDDEAVFPFLVNGAPLGFIRWKVQRPGAETLKSLGPTFAIAGVLIAVLGIYLVALIVRAVDRLIDTRDRLDQLARHDALTGLANRFAFEAALGSRSALTGPGKPRFALLYLDLDRFKDVNDLLGHPAGDDLLRSVARRLEREVGTFDIVARLGGDEFGILVPNASSEALLEALCRRIVAALATPFDIGGHRVDAGVSIGIALSEAEGESAEHIVRRADKALYRQKRAGRNGFSWGEGTSGDEIGQERAAERSIEAADPIRALVA